MGGLQTRPNINEAEYEQRFKIASQYCQTGPKEERRCNDICCLVTYIVLTLMFLGIGIYYMAHFSRDDLKHFKVDGGGAGNPIPRPIINGEASVNSHDSVSSLNFHRRSFFHATETESDLSGSSILEQHQSTQTKHQNHFEQKPMHEEANFGYAALMGPSVPNLRPTVPYIFMMAALALVLSFVIVILVSKIPKKMIYFMIALTSILVVAGLIMGIVVQLGPLIAVMVIFLIIWTIVLIVICFCFKLQFDAAIVLLKVTGSFIKHKPSVLLAPLFVMLISTTFFVFWLLSLIAIQLDRPLEQYQHTGDARRIEYNYTIHDVFTVFWLFLSLFYSYFYYYVMVFLIATSTSLWYYGIEGNYLFRGIKYICQSHVGSFSFASLLVAVVSFLRNVTENNNSEVNACSMCCFCMFRCCLQFLEEIIKVLNHNAIIVMSVTGEPYLDAAKSTIFLIFKNFGLFIAVDLVDFLVGLCIIFFVLLLPTGLGLFLLDQTYDQNPDGEVMFLIFGTLFIFLVCGFISMLVITILTQVLGCVFIFFCLDQKFRSFNYGIVERVPQEMRELFNEIEEEQRVGEFDRFYRQVNRGY